MENNLIFVFNIHEQDENIIQYIPVIYEKSVAGYSYVDKKVCNTIIEAKQFLKAYNFNYKQLITQMQEYTNWLNNK